jgi:hypothetical protein
MVLTNAPPLNNPPMHKNHRIGTVLFHITTNDHNTVVKYPEISYNNPRAAKKHRRSTSKASGTGPEKKNHRTDLFSTAISVGG